MADQFRKYQKGQPVSLPAAQVNAWTEAAIAERRRKRDLGAGAGGQPPNPGVVLVKNVTGSNRAQFDAVGLGRPLILPSDNLAEFQRQITFEGETPTCGHNGRFAILLEPLGKDRIGRAVLCGVVQSQIDFGQDGSGLGFADVAGGQFRLRAQQDGAAQILWAAGRSGLQQALLRIGNYPAALLTSECTSEPSSEQSSSDVEETTESTTGSSSLSESETSGSDSVSDSGSDSGSGDSTSGSGSGISTSGTGTEDSTSGSETEDSTSGSGSDSGSDSGSGESTSGSGSGESTSGSGSGDSTSASQTETSDSDSDSESESSSGSESESESASESGSSSGGVSETASSSGDSSFSAITADCGDAGDIPAARRYQTNVSGVTDGDGSSCDDMLSGFNGNRELVYGIGFEGGAGFDCTWGEGGINVGSSGGGRQGFAVMQFLDFGSGLFGMELGFYSFFDPIYPYALVASYMSDLTSPASPDEPELNILQPMTLRNTGGTTGACNSTWPETLTVSPA